MKTIKVLLPRLRIDIGLFGSFLVVGGVVVDISRWRSASREEVAGGGNSSGCAVPAARLSQAPILLTVGFQIRQKDIVTSPLPENVDYRNSRERSEKRCCDYFGN